MISDTQRLETLKQKKRSLEQMLEKMTANAQPEQIETLRHQWLDPIEREIEELEGGSG
jgi:hypothetical protein